MEYRKLGKWGARVSSLGFGSYLTIGFTSDADTSRAMVKRAYDAGINYFDTANAYNRGEAEKALGELLANYPRSALFVLTKVWAPMGDGPNDKGLSAKHIREQCDASLARLKMDYVDCYMCHRPDPDTPIEETVRAMEDLARAGKILYWGVSEWPAPLIVRANAVAREIGARPIAVSQPRYNLLYRDPEKNLYPVTAQEGIGNVVFSPLAHGMLTGKYKPGEEAPEGTRAADPRQNLVIRGMYWNEENKQKSQELVAMAKDYGVGAAELALAWCLRTDHVSSVILGASKVAQLEQNLKAVEVKLTDDVLERLDELFPPPGGGPGF
ncbi:MAG TPA: aldo/keto reductase family protein [Candidatus Hydrogenedentes bacterium]|nr:aldo/keto reductase family protein [Candidatus Hydrogenedentota bacterium]